MGTPQGASSPGVLLIVSVTGRGASDVGYGDGFPALGGVSCCFFRLCMLTSVHPPGECMMWRHYDV